MDIRSSSGKEWVSPAMSASFEVAYCYCAIQDNEE
jgi:hypothetical protein